MRTCLLSMAVLLGARSALAQPRAADESFMLGKALMDQGRVAEACAKFAASLALERRSGTLLNLATCREKEGRHATALRLFQEARERALRDGRRDRADLADEQIPRVRARLSWLTVKVAAGATAPDLVVRRDGEDLPRERWGEILAVDPGPHTVVALASGRPPFEATVTVGADGDARTIEIPAPEPEKAPAPAPLPVPAPPPAASAPLRVEPPPPPPRPLPGWVRPVGAAATSVGVASLVAGIVLGVRAVHDVRESDMLCPKNVCTTADAFRQAGSARTEAHLSDITIPLGLVTTAGGLYMLLRPRPERSPRLSVEVGRAGVSLRGGW